MLIADTPPMPPQMVEMQELHRTTSMDRHGNAEDREDGLSNIRLDALSETALTLGVRGGSAHRFKQIEKKLDNRDDELSRIYDFEPLLLNHGRVLPPVLLQRSDVLNIDEAKQVLRLSGEVFSIEKQVEFVTNPPNWRRYLTRGFVTTYPETPNYAVLPSTGEERDLWRDRVEDGWAYGVKQADSVMKQNFDHINRDMIGMITFHQLALEGKVDMPVFSRADMGVTGDGDEMVIDDKVLRITAQPRLNPNGEWTAYPGYQSSYPNQSYTPHYK